MPQSPLLGVAAIPAIPVTGTSIGVTPPSPLTSTDVQSIVDEIQAEIAAGIGVTVGELDGSPSVVATVIKVPDDSEDVVGTIATLNYAMRRGGTRGALDARSVSGAITLDLRAYNAFQLTLTGNVTSVTLSNPPPSGVDATWPIATIQGGSGGYTFAWPASAKWRASDGTNTGSATTLSTAVGGQDDFDLSTSDGGTTYGVTPGNVGSDLTIKDEGTPLATAATSLDFVGAGVVASGTTAAKTITIAGYTLTAAAVSALGFVGPILISDSPSTPLVFADLLQNEAQDDLIYADL